MNRNRDHYRQRGHGCARNSAIGGSLGYVVGSKPLIADRPDLSVYQTTEPSAGGARGAKGGAYTVDVSEDIAGMPIYERKTTVGGRLDTYEAPVAGYRFEPSTATAAGPPFNEVVSQNGRACAPAAVSFARGGGGCPYLGGVPVAEYDATQPPLFVKHGGRNRTTTIKFKRSKFNTTRKMKKSKKHSMKRKDAGRHRRASVRRERKHN